MTMLEICDIWAAALTADQRLADFCQEAWGRPLTVFLGYDEAREFGADDCPYAVMQPVEDMRGPEIEENVYSIALFLGLTAGPDYVESVDNGSRLQPALRLMEDQLAPLVMQALHQSPYPPERAEAELSPVIHGYIEKNMLITLTVPNTLGIGHNVWR